MDQNSNDDLKEKAKKSLKKIIDACTNLPALEPLIPVAPEKILKQVKTFPSIHMNMHLTQLK